MASGDQDQSDGGLISILLQLEVELSKFGQALQAGNGHVADAVGRWLPGRVASVSSQGSELFWHVFLERMSLDEDVSV